MRLLRIEPGKEERQHNEQLEDQAENTMDILMHYASEDLLGA